MSELKPLGYVEKADGSVEAVVSQGNRVWLVREGETFNDRFRVLMVSASAVKVEEESAPQMAPPRAADRTLAARRSIGPERRADAPLRSPQPMATQRVAEKSPVQHVEPVRGSRVLGKRPARAVNADAREGLSLAETSAGQKPIGYVQLSGGPVQNIVADGAGVQLIAQRETLAQDSSGGGTEDQVVAAAQQPVKEVSSLRRAPRDAEAPPSRAGPPIPATEPPGGPTSDLRLLPARMSSEDSPQGGNQASPAAFSSLKAICYVEKADGSVEGVVAQGNHAYLVREGEVFADRFRVRKISPSAIQVVDEASAEGLSPPESGQLQAAAQVPSVSPPRAASHSPPESAMVRDLAALQGGVSSNSEPSARTDVESEPILALALLSGPTSPWLGTSRTRGEVFHYTEPSDGEPAITSGTTTDLSKFIENPAAETSSAPLQDIPWDFRAKAASPVMAARSEITPLPLEASRLTMQIPEGLFMPNGGRAFSTGARPEMGTLASGGPTLSGAAGVFRQVQRPSGGPVLQPPGSVATLAGGRAPGFGLLLPFSIGDNTCNLPR